MNRVFTGKGLQMVESSLGCQGYMEEEGGTEGQRGKLQPGQHRPCVSRQKPGTHGRRKGRRNEGKRVRLT